MLYFIYSKKDDDDWYILTGLVACEQLKINDLKEFNEHFLHSETYKIIDKATYDKLKGVVPDGYGKIFKRNVECYYFWKSHGLKMPVNTAKVYLYNYSQKLYLSSETHPIQNVHYCIFTSNKTKAQPLYLYKIPASNPPVPTPTPYIPSPPSKNLFYVTYKNCVLCYDKEYKLMIAPLHNIPEECHPIEFGHLNSNSLYGNIIYYAPSESRADLQLFNCRDDTILLLDAFGNSFSNRITNKRHCRDNNNINIKI